MGTMRLIAGIGFEIAWCLFVMVNLTPSSAGRIWTVSNANAKSGQSGKVSATVLVFVVLLAVAGGGGAAWLILPGHGAIGAVGNTAASATGVVTVHLDGFTVNLADAQSSSFLRVTMDLALERLPSATERDKPASGLPMGRIRDTILTVLTQCKAQALLSSEGKAELKKQLLSELSRNLPELGVRDIYFTEFLVQR